MVTCAFKANVAFQKHVNSELQKSTIMFTFSAAVNHLREPLWTQMLLFTNTFKRP